jgi:AcrR family transcriptional regulator
LFLDHGYGATTLKAVADEAGVAVQTVYAGFGNKRELLKQVIDVSIVGDDEPLSIDQRPNVLAMRGEADPRKRARMAAAITRSIVEGAAPVFKIVRDAASAEPEVADLLRTMLADRRRGMRDAARALAGDGELRVPLAEAADILFVLYSPDVALLLLNEAGWSLDRYETWLTDMLLHALMREGSAYD